MSYFEIFCYPNEVMLSDLLSVCLCVPDTSEYWTRWALYLHSLPGGEEGHSRAACEGELDFTKWQNITYNWNVFGAQFPFCVVHSKSHPLKNSSLLFLSQIPGSMTAAELICEVLDRRNIMVRDKEYWSCWEISDKEEMGAINWKTVLLLSFTSTYVFFSEHRTIFITLFVWKATRVHMLNSHETWQGPQLNKTMTQSLWNTAPNLLSDLLLVTQTQEEKGWFSAMWLSVVVWFEPGMQAIWFPPGNRIDVLSNASNIQLMWQIAHHCPENQPADYRKMIARKGNKLERAWVTGGAGRDSVSHMFTVDVTFSLW